MKYSQSTIEISKNDKKICLLYKNCQYLYKLFEKKFKII